jgi:hypothetical protein
MPLRNNGLKLSGNQQKVNEFHRTVARKIGQSRARGFVRALWTFCCPNGLSAKALHGRGMTLTFPRWNGIFGQFLQINANTTLEGRDGRENPSG